jgi:hypothetical protein
MYACWHMYNWCVLNWQIVKNFHFVQMLTKWRLNQDTCFTWQLLPSRWSPMMQQAPKPYTMATISNFAGKQCEMTCKWCIAQNQYQFNAKVVGWTMGVWLPCKVVNVVHLEEGKVNVILLCCNKKWFHIRSLNVSTPLRLIPSKVCKRAATRAGAFSVFFL